MKKAAARRLEYLDLEKLRPAKRNPKLHAEEEIGASLQRFGYVEAMARDDRTGRLVAGHGRAEKLLEMKRAGKVAPEGVRVRGKRWLVPVLTGWRSKNDGEAEGYLVASNGTGLAAGWDDPLLAAILKDQNPEHLTALGFGMEEVNRLLAAVGEQPFPALPTGEKAPMEQMTFLLSTQQADRLRTALQAMMDNGMADEEAKRDGINENSNGNALAAALRYFEAREADDTHAEGVQP